MLVYLSEYDRMIIITELNETVNNKQVKLCNSLDLELMGWSSWNGDGTSLKWPND